MVKAAQGRIVPKEIEIKKWPLYSKFVLITYVLVSTPKKWSKMLISLNNQANCTCGSEQFQCQWGGGCIIENFDTNTNTNIFINTNTNTGCVANDLRCNGNFDCSDRSDELGCREVEEPGGTNVVFIGPESDHLQCLSLTP